MEHKQAYASHEKICKLWRSAGRPTSSDHPAKMAKLESQRNLQRIARDEKSMKERTNHDDLMTTFSQNASQVCRKLKQIRGENLKNIDLPFIDTLNGRFSGNNVLEGFCSNTETLCNAEMENEHEFYKMCVEDNMMIFDITSNEAMEIPHMTFEEDIFQRLQSMTLTACCH